MTASTALAVAIRRFLGDYLPHQRAFSAHTILSYRDSLKLLLQFAAGRKRRVADLTVSDLSPSTIIAFLDHLKQQRSNAAATRNIRLSAIHSFFDYLGTGYPEHLDQSQRVLAITFKRTDHRLIDYLEAEEFRTILEQIDRHTIKGRRDYVLLSIVILQLYASVRRISVDGSSFKHFTAASFSCAMRHFAQLSRRIFSHAQC